MKLGVSNTMPNIANLPGQGGGGGSGFINTKSILFDGIDDYVDCGNVWNLSTYTWSPFTLSFWYKGINPIVGAVHTKSLFQFMATGSQHIGIYDGYLGAANVRLYLLFGTTNNYWTVGSNGTVDLFDNEWHNVVIVFPPGSNDGVDDASSTLYIDGTLITKDSSATGTPPIGAFSWQMFNIMEGAWNPLQGNLDEVALWKTDQTANIATIYNSGTPADLTSLSPVSWWRMGDEITAWNNMPDQMGGVDAIVVNEIESVMVVPDVP